MMQQKPSNVIRAYIILMVLSTFAASFIWGINTLFLLDAGLSITEAFAANAFFTIGQVLFEVPTGIVADTVGRRASYLLGSGTLFLSTIFYLVLWQQHAAFWLWAVASALLGLGFTFFSGAMEAWLVDALHATHYRGTLESVFAKGQVAEGIALLSGTVIGAVVAQFTNLGVPYIMRAIALVLVFVVTWTIMKDIGFKPRPRTRLAHEVKSIVRSSWLHGVKNPPVGWLMLSGPFVLGVSIYGFYAMQPYLLELYGNPNSYAIAGISAAVVGGAQIAGGLIVNSIRKFFTRRTSLLAGVVILSTVSLVLMGVFQNFWVVLALLILWGILFAASFPVRQAYLNGLIPSEDRATVLSSDNLISSAGGVVFQPILGKSADLWGYPVSYILSGLIQLLALPFVLMAKSKNAVSDPITDTPDLAKAHQ